MKETNNASTKFWVRMMAWILCILMVVSLAYLTAALIVDQVRANKEAAEKAEKEAQENAEKGDEAEADGSHDHDGDGKDDH